MVSCVMCSVRRVCSVTPLLGVTVQLLLMTARIKLCITEYTVPLIVCFVGLDGGQRSE